MLDAELILRIRQLYYAEHWRIGTIADQLGVHPDAVRRAIGSDAFNRKQSQRRGQALDPYRELVQATLELYPRLRATRVFEMVRARGYRGSIVQLRRLVRELRPPTVPEAHLSLSHPSRGAGSGRLGELRDPSDWLERASAVVLRDGALVFARAVLRVLPRRVAGKLLDRTRARLHELRRIGPHRAPGLCGALVRQFVE